MAAATLLQLQIVWPSEIQPLSHEILTIIFLNPLSQIQVVKIISGLSLLILPAQVQTNLCYQVLLKPATAYVVLQCLLCGVFGISEQKRIPARSSSADLLIGFDFCSSEFAQGNPFPWAVSSPIISPFCTLTSITQCS